MNKKDKFKLALVEILHENLMNDLLPGGDKEIGKFLQKVEDTLMKFSGDLDGLIGEAGEMVSADLLLNANFGERNRALTQTIGTLKKLKSITVSAYEGLHGGMGFIKRT